MRNGPARPRSTRPAYASSRRRWSCTAPSGRRARRSRRSPSERACAARPSIATSPTSARCSWAAPASGETATRCPIPRHGRRSPIPQPGWRPRSTRSTRGTRRRHRCSARCFATSRRCRSSRSFRPGARRTSPTSKTASRRAGAYAGRRPSGCARRSASRWTSSPGGPSTSAALGRSEAVAVMSSAVRAAAATT